MFFDPFTLVVAPNAESVASGDLYLDDEITMAHAVARSYVYKLIRFQDQTLTFSRHPDSKEDVSASAYKPSNTIERIVITGQTKAITSATLKLVSSGEVRSLESFYDSSRQTVTIKKPDAPISEDWVISFN